MADPISSHTEKAPIVIFSKITCPYSCKTKKLITELGYKFKSVELDEVKDRDVLEDHLKRITGADSTPYIFIAKKYIGNNKDIQQLSRDSKLIPMLQGAGAPQYAKIY